MDRRLRKRGVGAIAASTATIALCLVCGGCAPQNYESVPDSHLDADDEVEFDHQRCGACHIGAQRGNPSFLYSEDGSVVDVFNVEIPEQVYDLPETGSLTPEVNLD